MSKVGEITVDVKTRMYVPKATADACLAIVTLYLNEHSDKMLEYKRNEDGSVEYRIVGDVE